MALADYRIPWQPLDLATPIAGLLEERHKREEEARAEENAKTQREFAERNMRIQNSREYRDQRDYEDRKKALEHQLAVEKANAIPLIMQAARTAARQYGPDAGAQVANQMGAPYGVSFQSQDQPGNAPATPLTAAANMYSSPAQGGNGLAAPEFNGIPTPSGVPGADGFMHPSDVPRSVGHEDVEGPSQAVDTPWGRELLPPDYHLDPEMKRRIEQNGAAPLGATYDRSPGAPPVIAAHEMAYDANDNPIPGVTRSDALPTGDVRDVQPTDQVPEPYTPTPVSATPGNELHAPGSEPTPEGPPVAQMASHPPTPSQHMLMAQFLGGKPFELKTGSDKLGLDPQSEELYHSLVEGGTPEKEARAFATKNFLENSKEARRDQRLADAIAGRKDIADTHTLTVEQKQSQFAQAEKDKLEAAHIRARAVLQAAGANATPAAVSKLVEMKEAGASDADVYAAAAQMKVPEKQFVQPVQNVVRNAAQGERLGQKREALVATDDKGNTIGNWKDAQASKTGEKQIQSYHRVKERLDMLMADIKRQGPRTNWNAGDIQTRVSLAKAVVAALRPFNELSNTAAGAQMEEDILGQIGSPGHGWLWGANAGIIDRLAKEAEGQHQAQLNTLLRPGGGSTLAPALGGQRKAARSGAAADESSGATRTIGGKTYKKVGPNNWQPVPQ